MNQHDNEQEQSSSSVVSENVAVFGEDVCQMTFDNSANILRTLKDLHTTKHMCDVLLSVGSKEYAAHRFILCAYSDVFEVMLTKREWTEWHESKIVLQEHPQCESIFPQFLEYFYTGQIIITHTNVLPILALADKYIVKSLSELCIKYMCKHIAHAAAYNKLFSWLQYTMNCGSGNVAKLCLQYIKWNLEAVANSPDFSNFELELFCNLLKQSDVIIYNETVLYNCAVRWLELQEIQLRQTNMSSEDLEEVMKNMVDSVMKCIRFPMMNPREIAALLPSPLIKRYSHLLLDRMAAGIIYQSGRIDENETFWKSDQGKLLSSPRLYTCDSFNMPVVVENVSSLPSYHVNTYVFSTHTSIRDFDSDRVSEWVVDLYPKGVWFKKCSLISWQGTFEVPESVKSTVRITLMSREPIEKNLKVQVGILLYGNQSGSEHVLQVVQRMHYFTSQDNMLVIDDLLPFNEFNHNLLEANKKVKSCYLTGANRDQLKINIIITPIN